MADPFMLVSLNEEKAKRLAQVLSNPTATRILEYLTKREATETEISKALKIPLSTVHYNLKQLTEARLVIADEFHYSEKGREVNHYKIANKYIIIAPEEDKEGFLDRLKRFVPAAAIVIGAAVVIKLAQFFAQQPTSAKEAVRMAAAPAEESVAMMAMDAEAVAVQQIPWWQSPIIDWFLAGAIFVLVVLFISETIGYWRWKRGK